MGHQHMSRDCGLTDALNEPLGEEVVRVVLAVELVLETLVWVLAHRRSERLPVVQGAHESQVREKSTRGGEEPC